MEYERTLTMVANNYVKPQMVLYLNNLQNILEGKSQHLRILRSDGGLSFVALASKFPVNLALSDPARGVSGTSSVVAAQTIYKNLITVDMGGTSTDVALIENGTPRHSSRDDKALRVGPESSGAAPGPACYGKGGVNVTASDANSVLGYLPEYLLGGTFKLDLEAARKACRAIADDLGIDLYAAAEGILKIANETMYGALRLVSVE
jgi:5-oxoprolinase (ATP-hydrolysing)